MKNSQFYSSLVVIVVMFLLLLSIFSFFPINHVFIKEADCINGADNHFIGYSDTEYYKISYQEKVIELLSNRTPADYRYFFQNFIDEDPNTYMYVKFIGQTGCFTVKMTVDIWDILEGMKRTNGVSWPSELRELKWVVEIRDGTEELIYVDMYKIID